MPGLQATQLGSGLRPLSTASTLRLQSQDSFVVDMPEKDQTNLGPAQGVLLTTPGRDQTNPGSAQCVLQTTPGSGTAETTPGTGQNTPGTTPPKLGTGLTADLADMTLQEVESPMQPRQLLPSTLFCMSVACSASACKFVRAGHCCIYNQLRHFAWRHVAA